MERLYKPSRIRQEPLITICWIIGIMAIIGGLYLVSPWLIITEPTGANAIFESAASQPGLYALSGLAIFSGIAIIAGILKNKVRWIRVGVGLNLILRFYALLIGLLAYGVDGGIISTGTIVLIVLVVYLALGRKP